jgi:hypothetical protein
MCEAQVWRAGAHWRCGLLKGHDLTHAFVLVTDSFPFMEDEDIEEDDEEPGQDETNTLRQK